MEAYYLGCDMMNNREFEQRFLELVFRSNVRLTPATVAYRLGMPIAEVKRQLEGLLTQGVVELQSDAEGNLFYVVPGVDRPERDELPLVSRPKTVAAPRQLSIGMILLFIFLVGLVGRIVILMAFLLGGKALLASTVFFGVWMGLRSLWRLMFQADLQEGRGGPNEW